MPLSRPAPYVPLSVTFATGKTGTAILERFGPAGLGAWAALLATAGVGNTGEVLFRHEDDWAAIGLGAVEFSFSLTEFLRFLGQQKQTRTTRQARARYVQITQWERWNNAKKREQARQRMSRKRGTSERNGSEHEANENEQERHPDTETEAETDLKAFREAHYEGKGLGFELSKDLTRSVA